MTETGKDLISTTTVRKTYSVQEIAEMLSIGKNKAYELCSSGQFKIVRVGRSIRVVKQSFDMWLNEDSQ